MNKTKIEWCDYTWNPVVGCKHGCSYCYAEAMNKRFKYIDDWQNPVFYPERLKEPYQLKKSSIIFVGSMTDLFGYWIDMDWIYKVIKVAEQCPQHMFMFLTKNPVGYNGFSFPDNCMMGFTMTRGNQLIVDEFKYYTTGRKFLSIEPILGSFAGINLNRIDKVIVGAMTGQNAVKPEKEWIESIKHPNILYKNNIKEFML